MNMIRQFWFFVMLSMVSMNFYGQECDVSRDSTALMQLYYATGGDNWNDNTNWGTSEPLWAWYGVQTGEGGCVDILNLGNNNLTGQLPPEIGNLLNTTQILLNDNSINGVITPEIGNLINLQELDIYNNSLSGEIPSEIGNLTDLQYLYLGYNQLEGSIPSALTEMSGLVHVFLDHNQFTGDIPANIGNMQSLQWLDLNTNMLTGMLPSSIGQLQNLKDLYLSNNMLSGALPPEIGNLQNLVELDVYNNNFSGQIPVQIGYLDSLKYLYLSYNDFSGFIPEEICNLSNLEHLFLDSNELQGAIPANIGDLSGLILLFMDSNRLNGNIPESMGLLSQLTEVDLYRNRLEGTIPAALGDLQNLQYLYLYENNLSGEIPAELSNLVNIRGFYLDRNGLSGCIPQSVTDMLCNLQYNPESYLDGYNLIQNPQLPYQGDMQFICDGSDQINAPCDDQNPETFDDIITGDCSCAGTPKPVDTCRAGDSIALMVFYHSTGGENWKRNDNWGTALPLKYWYGVHTDSQSCVTCIDMDGVDDCGIQFDNGNNLRGTLPGAIKDLKHLKTLNLNFNHIKGKIPASLSEIDSLKYLYLRYNAFSGTIPPDLADINTLQGLYLDNNNLSGCIPGEILDSFCILGFNPSSEMTGYNLTHNPLLPYQGDMQAICEGADQTGAPCDDNNPLTQYDRIREDCTCKGIIVKDNPCRSRDSSALMSIYRSTDGNNWKRNDHWGSSKPLNEWYGVGIDTAGCVETLYLCDNNLTGKLPLEIGTLEDLKYLYLCQNNITGLIPVTTSKLKKLKALVLSRNNLSGVIPAQITGNVELEYLYLNNNDFTGQIPASLNLIKKLKHLYLNNNELAGTLPSEIGQLKELTDLSLYNNNLSGDIPSELAQLGELKRFYIQNNEFSGCIPEEILQSFCPLGYNPLPNTNNGWDGYDLTGNNLLPYKGDMQRICNGARQVGAPCDDSNPLTRNDTIGDDCGCNGEAVDNLNLNDKESLTLYPNPATDKIFISSGADIYSIVLYNAIGEKLKTIESDIPIHVLELNDMPATLLVIKLYGQNGKRFIRKILLK